MPNEEMAEIPKAFVVLHEGMNVGPEDLMNFVAERVAPYRKIREVAFIREVP